MQKRTELFGSFTRRLQEWQEAMEAFCRLNPVWCQLIAEEVSKVASENEFGAYDLSRLQPRREFVASQTPISTRPLPNPPTNVLIEAQLRSIPSLRRV